MKQVITAIITLAAVIAQAHFIGINGLTLVSIPLTIYLGLEVIEKITIKHE